MFYLVMLVAVFWFFRMGRAERRKRHRLRQDVPSKKREYDDEEYSKNRFEAGGTAHHFLKATDEEKDEKKSSAIIK